MISSEQWGTVLTACGVRTLRVLEWAPIFARYVQPASFSLADRELDDFVGQVLHETGALSHIEEVLNYSAARIREIGSAAPVGSRWRSLVPKAAALAFNPEAFAEAVYGGRLGNDLPGDGWKYRGGGIPMVTGKANYALLEKLTGLPLVGRPELLRLPDAALRCGVLWWEAKVPDSAIDSIERVTRAVNGGVIGLEDRTRYTALARAALAKVLS